MPWYKAGTVSVVQNSNAVVGTGTAFIVNARVGDAFRGPDGGWYEVTNIASDTAMSISPNYQGATAGAGTYALAPMQGYVKDSADALRALVNQFGTKLAALGTTGNYDVLPTSKGGTGIADLSAFIQSLLNDADAVSGRATLGAAKAGANNDISSLSGLTTPISVTQGGTGISDLSAFIQTLLNDPDAASGRATLGAAKSGANSDITSIGGLTTALSVSQGGTGGSSQAAARAGLGLGSAAVAALVGTVSQSSGVANGAAMEYVNNTNGEAWKFANGLLVCIRYIGSAIAFTVSPGASVSGGVFALPVAAAGTGIKLYTGYATDAGTNVVGSSWIDSGFGNQSWKFQVSNLSATITITQLLATQMFYIGRWF